MNEKTVSGFHALAVALASSVVPPALAQSSRWPSADVIAGADHYDPPKATALAAKLSQQPDMTGLWIQLAPKGSGAGPTFDPAHTFYSPPQPGHSVGHWDGNTLVVDTVDMIVANFDETSAPYSSKLRMVERLRLIDVAKAGRTPAGTAQPLPQVPAPR